MPAETEDEIVRRNITEDMKLLKVNLEGIRAKIAEVNRDADVELEEFIAPIEDRYAEGEGDADLITTLTFITRLSDFIFIQTETEKGSWVNRLVDIEFNNLINSTRMLITKLGDYIFKYVKEHESAPMNLEGGRRRKTRKGTRRLRRRKQSRRMRSTRKTN
jgi:hypothetical protein